MPRGDYRHREPKKPKKTAKKPAVATILPTPSTVEVVGKKRKPHEETEE